MNFNKFFIFGFIILFLFSCAGTKDVLEGKTRADKSDEFLVEKKNPLSMPPDFNELPEPSNEKEEKQINIKEKLQISNNRDKTDQPSDNSSLEEKILKKIN